jgi:type IV pilus assembly protein PilA
LIDYVLASGNKSGYKFQAVGANVGGGTILNTFTSQAVPQGIGSTGQRGFGSDQSGVIRYTLDGSVPAANSSALQ